MISLYNSEAQEGSTDQKFLMKKRVEFDILRILKSYFCLRFYNLILIDVYFKANKCNFQNCHLFSKMSVKHEGNYKKNVYKSTAPNRKQYVS